MPFRHDAVEAECVALRRGHAVTVPLSYKLDALRAIPGEIAGIKQENIGCSFALGHRESDHVGSHTRPASHVFVTGDAPPPFPIPGRGRACRHDIPTATWFR